MPSTEIGITPAVRESEIFQAARLACAAHFATGIRLPSGAHGNSELKLMVFGTPLG